VALAIVEAGSVVRALSFTPAVSSAGGSQTAPVAINETTLRIC
jgi:hypothetical protein